jgi:glycerol-3-phosphate acyltransferase PlsX
MKTVIAVDAMGGDHGPTVTVPACVDFLESNPEAELLLVGLKEPVERELARVSSPHKARITVVPATEVVGSNEDVRTAIRTKKDSSMRVAIDLVKEGRAQACVSAGNTGALMGTAKFVLKTLPGIDRPAICAVLPTRTGQVYALDLGANADCTPEQLQQFAIMGATLVREVEGKPRPTVGLSTSAPRRSRATTWSSRQRSSSSARRSTSTATSRATTSTRAPPTWWCATASSATWRSRRPRAWPRCWATSSRRSSPAAPSPSAAVSYPVIKRFRRRVDHRRYNGAALLGLKGIVVKSHGSADRLAFSTALKRAASEASHGLIEAHR